MSRIAVVDFETSGLDPDAKVVEMGRTDLVRDYPDGPWRIEPTPSRMFRCEVIPPAARAVHHIRPEETLGCDAFDAGAFWSDLLAASVDVVAAHNAAYDGQYWGEPRLPLICTFKAARRLWPDAPSHGNGALRYWLADQQLIDPEMALTMPPHRAGPDAYVTAHILAHMLSLTTGAEMARWTKEPLLQPRIAFGKHKGEWSAAPGDYLDWIVRKSDLDADTKWNAQREIDRRRAAA